MKLSYSPVRSRRAWPLLFTVAALALPVQAFTLTATPSATTFTCSTATGPGAAVNVVVKPAVALTGSNTIAVTLAAVTGLTITPPSPATLTTTNQAAGITFAVRAANGCAAATSGAKTLQFSAGTNSDVSTSLTLTVTVASASVLTATPSPLTVYCTRTPPVGSGSATYLAAPAQTIAIKSNAAGGTPFTVDNVTSAPPSWLTVTPLTGGTATTTAVNFTVRAVAGCGSLGVNTVTPGTIHLLNAPAPDKVLQVSLRIVPPSSLVAAPSPVLVPYVKGSGAAGRVDVSLTSATTPAPFFIIDTATLPIWLNVDVISGSVPKSLRFTTTTAADSMAPGTYSGTVKVQVANFADLSLPVILQLNNPPPKLSIAESLTRSINWTVGTLLPTPYVTAVSSDAPIPYTIDTGGPLAPIVSAANQKDLAYSIGTPIPITFDPNVFAAATPGTVLTGTVSLTWGSPVTVTTVTIAVSIVAPGATVTSITPASLPTANPGQTFTLVMSGSNFIASSDPNVRTKVGIISGSNFVVDPSISVQVANPSNIILTIVVPSSSTTLPFAPGGAGGTVVLGVCNPSNGNCSVPTSQVNFGIGGSPIIQSVASASSFLQVTAPAIPTIAPYDLISIFGSNFCSSGGTGCASSDVLRGVPDPLTLSYPTSLTPDLSGNIRQLTAVFQTHATPPVLIATAPLLFASNGQINLVVPAALSANSGNTVDLVVSFGYGTGATMLSSAAFPVTVADTDPGVFTVTGDGQGLGAVLNANLSPVGVGTEAGLRSTATDSDIVQIFMTGLGVPNSTGNNVTAGTTGTYSDYCVSPQTYLDALNLTAGSALTVADGLVISSALLNTNWLVPCFLSASSAKPSVTIGGLAATVTYAGWVPDSLAGQYQVNVRLPGSTGSFITSTGATISAISTPVQLPVVVTSGGRSSQAGVLMWATRKLKVTGPSGAGLTGQVGVSWSGSSNSVGATEGATPYRFAVTSGLLPAGLALNPTTGAITGIPAASTAGSYLVTVTATDSANFPVTDKVSFTLTITGGLVLTNTGTSPIAEVYSVADATVTTIAGTGGVYPYLYTLTGPSPVPAGLTIDPATGIVSINTLVPAGTYHVAVTATDSTSGTPLQGVINFDVVVALKLVDTAPQPGANGTSSTITTVTATGGTGALTYTLDSTSAALPWLAINASTGVITITNAAQASTSRSVTVTATAGSSPAGAASPGTGTLTFTLIIG